MHDTTCAVKSTLPLLRFADGALLAWLLLSCMIAVSAAADDLAGYQLLITSVRTGDTEIFLVDPHLGTALNLSRSPQSEERYPCWSPDGNQVAFISDRNHSTNLYVMDADGGNVQQLTHTSAVCYMPSWAQTDEGERIVFGMHGERPEMASIQPDGTSLVMLGEGHDPCCSPNGQLIAYTGHVPGGVTVFLMDPDGSHKRKLVNHANPFGAVFPNWSPDSRQIVFSQDVGEGLELFLVNPDGTGLSQLTRFGQVCTPAAWSPDGRWISFRRTDEMYWRSPERAKIIYSEKPAEKRPVWVIHPDGTGPHVIEPLRFQCAVDGSRASFRPMVAFPRQGALPSDFPPDEKGVDARTLPDGVYIITEPRRSRQQVRCLLRFIPGGTFSSPADRWQHLPHTHDRLANGHPIHIVNLGDSIVNDIARSGWLHLLREQYPKTPIRMTTIVRGGTGCWYYKEENRVRDLVVPQEPDLVIIGGLSQRGDVDSIREVIAQLRAQTPAEILLLTAAFGRMDPHREASLSVEACSGYAEYGAELEALAGELQCGFLDMTRQWARYIQQSGQPTDFFKRDAVHANEKGEMILARIMAAYFAPVHRIL